MSTGYKCLIKCQEKYFHNHTKIWANSQAGCQKINVTLNHVTFVTIDGVVKGIVNKICLISDRLLAKQLME